MISVRNEAIDFEIGTSNPDRELSGKAAKVIPSIMSTARSMSVFAFLDVQATEWLVTGIYLITT